jgi:hypothetical protein
MRISVILVRSADAANERIENDGTAAANNGKALRKSRRMSIIPPASAERFASTSYEKAVEMIWPSPSMATFCCV